MITLDSAIIFPGKPGKTVRDLFHEGGDAIAPLRTLKRFKTLARMFAEEKDQESRMAVLEKISEIREEVKDSIRQVEFFMNTFGSAPVQKQEQVTLFSLIK